MADRYWVGGTGTWNTTSTTNWSTTSGGAGGASVPTTSDNVFFDGASAAGNYTVTLTGALNCLNLSVAKSAAGTFGTASTGTLTVAGSVSITGPDVSWAGTGAWTYTAATPQTITTGGITLPAQTINNAVGSWQLQDAFTTRGALIHTAGTLNINSQPVTCLSFSSNGTGVRVLNYGTSTFTVTGNATTVWSMSVTTNLTITGTVTVNFTYAGSVGNRVAQSGTLLPETTSPTFNVVAGSDVFACSGNILDFDMTGFAGTFACQAILCYGDFILGASLASVGVSNSRLTLAGSSGTQVITTNGKLMNMPVTVDCFGSTRILTDDFNQGTSTFGTMALNTGTLDMNGRTMTTQSFTSGVTTVRQLIATGATMNLNGTGTVWNIGVVTNLTMTGRLTVNLTSTTSPTSRSIGNQLPPETTPNFNVLAGTDTVVLTGTCNDMNLTGFSGTWGGGAKTINGNFTVSSGTTFQSSVQITTFAPTAGATTTVVTAGKTFPFPVTIAGAAGSTVELNGNLTLGTGASVLLNLASGTLNLNGFAVTAFGFTSTGVATRSLIATGSTFNIFGNAGTVFNTTPTNFTPVGLTVNLTYAAGVGTRVVSTGALLEATAPNFIAASGSDILSMVGNYGSMSFVGFTGSLINPAGRIVYGNWTLGVGMTVQASNINTQFAATSGTQLITTNGVVVPAGLIFTATGARVQLQDNLNAATGASAATLVSLFGGELDLNNFTLSCAVFACGSSVARVLNFGAGGVLNIAAINVSVWQGANSTGFSYTGTPAVNFTGSGLAGQARTIVHGTTGGSEATAPPPFVFATGADTITTTAGSHLGDMIFTTFTGALNNAARTIYGNLTVSATTVLNSGAAVTTFAASGLQTINVGTQTVSFPITHSSVGATGTLRLLSNLTMANSVLGTFSLEAGTTDLNGRTISAGVFNSTTSNTRVLDINGGAFNIITNAITVWNMTDPTGFSYPTVPVFNFTYALNSGARTISGGLATSSNAVDFNFSSGTDTILLNANCARNVNFTGFTGTLSAAGRTIFGNLTLNPGMTVSTAAENQATVFAGNIGPATITTNGVATNFPITVNKAGGTFTLSTPLVTPRALTVTAGNLLANSLAVTAASFSATGNQARSVNFSNSTVTLTGAGWDFGNSANATLVSNNSNIILSATTANARTFNTGEGLTYANLVIGGATGSSTLTMSGNSTWTGTISSTKTVPHAILFAPGSVTTMAGWTVTGTPTAALTLGSTTPLGVNRLVYTGIGTINIDHATISYSNARPLGTWFAGNSSVNDGNNNGWTFANEPQSGAGFFFII